MYRIINHIRIVIILLYLLTNCVFSFNTKNNSSKILKLSLIAPLSDFNKNFISQGIINSPKLNQKVRDNNTFHKMMIDPYGSNFFGCLFYAIEKTILTEDDSFVPFILLQTFGGGADIAGAYAKGKWILDIICKQEHLKKIFKEKYNKKITPSLLIQKKLIEFSYIGCPEKRLSHKSLFENDKEASSEHHAFYNGIRLPDAGFMPKEIINTNPVTILDKNNTKKHASLIHELTQKTHFVMNTTNAFEQIIKIPGKELEDVKILNLLTEELGIKKIQILTLHGTIHEARKELHQFVKYKVTNTIDNKALSSKSKRETRPCFCLWPDTGGDTFMARSPKSTTTKIISPVNEAYNFLVAAVLLKRKEGLEISALSDPFSLTVDGESEAESANTTVEDFFKKDIVLGVVTSFNPKIIQSTLKNIFGLGQNSTPILNSHANLKAFKLLWKASIFSNLGTRMNYKSLNDFKKKLKPLKNVGSMPRYDVPVVQSETIVDGSSLGNVKEYAFLLNANKAFDYFLQTNNLDYKSCEKFSYKDLRYFLEKEHMVIGENELPSYSEYEILKILFLQNSKFSIPILEDKNSKYFIPNDENRKRIVKSDNIKDAHTFLHTKNNSNLLTKRLLIKFLKDSRNINESNTGILRMNIAYIKVFLKDNWPNIYQVFIQSSTKEQKQILDNFFDFFSNEIVKIIQNITDKNTDPNFLLNIAYKIINKEHLKTYDEKLVESSLKILRINTELNKFILEKLQNQNNAQDWPIIYLIAEAQRKIIQGKINNNLKNFDSKTKLINLNETFAIQHIDKSEILNTAKSFQIYANFIKPSSGKFEKMYKNFTNLILLTLATNKLDTLYKALTIFYYIIPENLHKLPNKEIFNQSDKLNAFVKVREAIYSTRKKENTFIELFNGLLINKFTQHDKLKRKYQKKEYKSLIKGFFIVTSNPQQTQLFQRPFTTISGFDIKVLIGVIQNFKKRIQLNLEKIKKLNSLKSRISARFIQDYALLYKDNNYIKLLELMDKDMALVEDFKKMITEGLLLGKSMKDQINELTELHKEKQEKWSEYYNKLLSKLPDELFNKIFKESA